MARLSVPFRTRLPASDSRDGYSLSLVRSFVIFTSINLSARRYLSVRRAGIKIRAIRRLQFQDSTDSGLLEFKKISMSNGADIFGALANQK